MQSLYLGVHDGKPVYAVVDRIFAGAGQAPRRVVQDGQVIQLPEILPPPTVAHREGKGYFYLDVRMTPVTDPRHVEHLPEKFKVDALAWIERTRGRAVPSLTTTAKQAAKAVRRPHRKYKRREPGGITDEASLHRATGGVTAEQAAAVMDQQHRRAG